MHGGTLTAASDGENMGATFLVRLPVHGTSAHERRGSLRAAAPRSTKETKL